jgi:hypothetical protein
VAGRGLKPIRHYLFVDRKWPLPGRRLAVTLALGFLWESASKYSGSLAAGRSSTTAYIVRPNLEF